jgi:glycosyltransferase involved in cell wall biosynthesis
MKILQIAPQVPYPPSDGGKVGIFNITRHLAALGHEVSLFALDRTSGVEYGPLREFCELRTVTHSTGNSAPGALLNIFSDLPYTISKYRSANLQNQLVEFVERHRPDVVHVDHLHMAEYGVSLGERFGLPVVLREHNVESVIMERYGIHARNPALRWYASLQHRRLHAYEAAMVGRFDYCCPITPDDAARLAAMNPGARIRIVPGGVDDSYFTPPGDEAVLPDSLVFFGALDWIPNQDALRWFINGILPLVAQRRPGVTLHVIGKNAPGDLLRMAGERCVFHGFIGELRPEVQKYAVSIAPYRIGGGMRLKILESFAMGVPVVATPVGCEGIEASHGEQLLIGGNEREFSDHVVALLTDPARRATIRDAARQLAQRRYRWQSVAEMFEGVYADAARSPKGAGR